MFWVGGSEFDILETGFHTYPFETVYLFYLLA